MQQEQIEQFLSHLPLKVPYEHLSFVHLATTLQLRQAKAFYYAKLQTISEWKQ